MTSFRIAKLAQLVEGWRQTSAVRALADDLADKVLRGKAPFEGAPLPDSLVKDRLPPGIVSAWVFVIKPKTRAPLHKHPNSIQHTSCIAGTGATTIGRRTDVIQPFDPAYPLKSVYVIPEGVPHAFEAFNDPLVLLSFHTVLPETLLEVEVESGQQRRYIEQDGVRARRSPPRRPAPKPPGKGRARKGKPPRRAGR